VPLLDLLKVSDCKNLQFSILTKFNIFIRKQEIPSCDKPARENDAIDFKELVP